MTRETEAKFVIKGEDRTGPAADSARRRIKSISDQLQELQSIGVAGIGFHQIAAAVAAVHTSALEAEKSTNALNAVLKATGNAAGLTKGQIEELVDELTGSTLFDDESLRAAAAALLRFRDIQEDVFRDALRMAPDLATALGTDVVSAAQTLGKALVDPEHGLKGLKAAGLKLSEQQGDLAQKLVETGDRAGAARLVLEELKKSIGGAAGEANTGLSQATGDTKKAWGELLEAIGNTQTYQQGARNFLGGLTALFSDLKGEIEGAHTNLRGFVGYLLDNSPVIGTLAGGLGFSFEREFKTRRSGVKGGKPGMTGWDLAGLDPVTGRAKDAGAEEQQAKDAAVAQRREQQEAAAYARRKKAAEEAAKREKEEAAKRTSFIQAVQKERDKALLGETDSKLSEAERLGIKGADLERIKGMLQEVDARKALLAAARENNAEFDKEFQEIERRREALENIIKTRREDAEAQQLEVDLINESEPVRRARVAMLDLERAGVERNSAAWRQLYETTLRTEEQREQMRKFKDEHRDMFEALKSAVEGWGRKFTDTVTEMVMKGRLEFKSMADSIISDLVRIQIQKRITDPLVKAGTVLLDGWFGNGTQAPAPVVDATPIPVSGARAAGGPVSAGEWYLVGEKGPEPVWMPRNGVVYPNGSLREMPQSGGVEVHIHEAPGTTARIEQHPDGNGGQRLDVIIEQIEGTIARNMAAGRSAIGQVGERLYNWNRAAGATR